MAESTGHTIADASGVAGSPSAQPRSQFWTIATSVTIATSMICAALITAPDAHAGKPTYRSVSQGQSSAQSSPDQDPAQPGKVDSGAFALGKLLGGKLDRRTAYDELLAVVPMQRLTTQTQQRLASIAEKPTLYRRLPTQAIRCDEELFLFLTRKPEVIIGIWDLMGITKVQATRTGPYKLDAEDGSGTTCEIDLVYGDRNLHVFVADGMYDGRFTQAPIVGKGLFVFKSSYAVASDGATTVTGTLDCYIKFESLGADLVARSLGGLIGKSADHNFVETAKFISQISQACETNPDGMLEMIDRMPQVDGRTKAEFARVIMNVARRSIARAPTRGGGPAKLVRDQGITETQR